MNKNRAGQVSALVNAAADGMTPLAAQSSAEEVINALLNLGARGVQIACENPDNRAEIRAHLECLLLETITPGRAM